MKEEAMKEEAGMPAHFAPAASRLCGLMGLLFHWTPDQYWHATPHEVETLLAALRDMRGGEAGAITPPDAATMEMLCGTFPDGG